MKTKTAIVTGGSSGIGLETAILLQKDGYNVYELSRRDFTHPAFTHIKCDVTDENAIIHAINQIAQNCDSIDLLVTCAGFGIAGAVEFTEYDDMVRQIDVNYFGTVNAVKAVLPHMRKQDSGTIICVSSVAAVIPIPFQTHYSVTKAAINAFVQALANEIKHFNIKVCAVMPGDTKTSFTKERNTNYSGDDSYSGKIRKSIETMEKDELSGDSPLQSAKLIVKLAHKRSLAPLYTAGFKYKVFVFIAKILPKKIVNRIVHMMYVK